MLNKIQSEMYYGNNEEFLCITHTV